MAQSGDVKKPARTATGIMTGAVIGMARTTTGGNTGTTGEKTATTIGTTKIAKGSATAGTVEMKKPTTTNQGDGMTTTTVTTGSVSANLLLSRAESDKG